MLLHMTELQTIAPFSPHDGTTELAAHVQKRRYWWESAGFGIGITALTVWVPIISHILLFGRGLPTSTHGTPFTIFVIEDGTSFYFASCIANVLCWSVCAYLVLLLIERYIDTLHQERLVRTAATTCGLSGALSIAFLYFELV